MQWEHFHVVRGINSYIHFLRFWFLLYVLEDFSPMGWRYNGANSVVSWVLAFCHLVVFFNCYYFCSLFSAMNFAWWSLGVFWRVWLLELVLASNTALFAFVILSFCSSWTRSLGIHPGRTFWREDLRSVEASKWDKWHHYTLWGEENWLSSKHICHRAFLICV